MGATETKTWTVYHLLNAAGKRIRIGCTEDLARRLRQYRYEHAWFQQVTRVIQASRWTSKQQALEHELTDIRKWRPIHNEVDGRSRDRRSYHRHTSYARRDKIRRWHQAHKAWRREYLNAWRKRQRTDPRYRLAIKTDDKTRDLFENA